MVLQSRLLACLTACLRHDSPVIDRPGCCAIYTCTALLHSIFLSSFGMTAAHQTAMPINRLIHRAPKKNSVHSLTPFPYSTRKWKGIKQPRAAKLQVTMTKTRQQQSNNCLDMLAGATGCGAHGNALLCRQAGGADQALVCSAASTEQPDTRGHVSEPPSSCFLVSELPAERSETVSPDGADPSPPRLQTHANSWG